MSTLGFIAGFSTIDLDFKGTLTFTITGNFESIIDQTARDHLVEWGDPH